MESVVKRSLGWYLVIMVVGIYNIGITTNLFGKFLNVAMAVISSALFIGLLRDWKNLNTESDTVSNNQS